MLENDMLETLGSAEAHLDCAVRSLLEMNSPAETCPSALQRAADLLTSLADKRNFLNNTSDTGMQPGLQAIAVKAAKARRFLESAANLYFGAVLNHGSLQQGYGVDGVADRAGGGALRVEA